MGHFQLGFFEGGKGGAVGQQFGSKRAPARLGLGIVVGVARPAEAGQGAGLRGAKKRGSQPRLKKEVIN